MKTKIDFKRSDIRTAIETKTINKEHMTNYKKFDIF